MCHFKDLPPEFDGIEVTEDVYPRQCTICGELMWSGYMDNDTPGMWYACDDCMDKMLADGLVRPSEGTEHGDANKAGGYYDFNVEGEWVPCDVFYTDWWF